MRRRFLLVPALTLSAWAQQTPPPAADTEAALRERVSQFYQFEVEKKFRQAESLLTEESKDRFYNGIKPDIRSFVIDRIELKDNGTRADVHARVKTPFYMPGVPVIVADSAVVTNWRIEDGKWVQYLDPDAILETPFGRLQPVKPDEVPSPIPPQYQVPDLDTLKQMVKVDHDSIALTPAAPDQTATISNGFPGGVDLEVVLDKSAGVEAKLDKTHLDSGDRTVIHFRAKDSNRWIGNVEVLISPVGQQLDIRVTANN